MAAARLADIALRLFSGIEVLHEFRVDLDLGDVQVVELPFWVTGHAIAKPSAARGLRLSDALSC